MVRIPRARTYLHPVTGAFFGATGSRLAKRGRGGLFEKLGDMNEAIRTVPRDGAHRGSIRSSARAGEAPETAVDVFVTVASVGEKMQPPSSRRLWMPCPEVDHRRGPAPSKQEARSPTLHWLQDVESHVVAVRGSLSESCSFEHRSSVQILREPRLIAGRPSSRPDGVDQGSRRSLRGGGWRT